MFKRKFRSPNSVIGPKMEVQGYIYLDENIFVAGILHGSAESYGTLEISTTGLIEGKIVKARRIIVNGILKADKIIADESIIITKTGRIEGLVVANSISIEAGAQVFSYVQSQELQSRELQMSEIALVDGNGLKKSIATETPLVTPIVRKWNIEDFIVP
jgi:cytoskeletal protein CcmA (bactofilin family)